MAAISGVEPEGSAMTHASAGPGGWREGVTDWLDTVRTSVQGEQFRDRLDAWLGSVPVRIIAIVLLALIAQALLRWLLRRVIQRAATRAQAARDADVVPGTPAADPGVPAAAVPLEAGERARVALRVQSIGTLLGSIVGIVVWTVALLMILPMLRIDIAPLLASAGVLGVALGFGAQTIIRDYLAGIFLIIEDQYGIGDLVDLNGIVGTVEEVSLRCTRLRDPMGVVWYVRNGEILTVANRSQGWSRSVGNRSSSG